jgi:hypothetical protein
MYKLNDCAAINFEVKIRSLSRQAAIEVLLGIVKLLKDSPGKVPFHLGELLNDAVLLTEVKGHESS